MTLFACSDTKTSVTFIPILAQDDEAIIYIYRPSAMANMMYSPDLYINDQYHVSIDNKMIYHFSLTPGDYRLKLEREDKITGNQLPPKKLDAAKVYFFRIDSKLQLSNSAHYEAYQREFIITEAESSLAKRQIEQCCMKPEQVVKKAETATDNTEQGSGFSVDKTQNPFSH